MDALAHPPPSRLAEGSLVVLAVVAVVGCLYVGRGLLIPVALGMVLAITVHPLVISARGAQGTSLTGGGVGDAGGRRCSRGDRRSPV